MDDILKQIPVRSRDAVMRMAVSDDIVLNPVEIQIIDTKEFQRLRKIKQLGATYCVYPSAVYSRFEHSIGCLNKAQEIIDSINRPDNKTKTRISRDEAQIIRIAALLHDIGHVPFGHSLEDEIKIVNKHDSKERLDYFLRKSEIGKILEKCEIPGIQEEVYRMLSCKKDDEIRAYPYPYRIDIIANTICADLLDYLQRDLYFTGLELSYDKRFIKYFEIQPSSYPDGKERLRLTIRMEKEGKYRYDVLSDIMILLRLRYLLAERIYFHHAKDSASAMIGKAFEFSDMFINHIKEFVQKKMLDKKREIADVSSQRKAKEVSTLEKYAGEIKTCRDMEEVYNKWDSKLFDIRQEIEKLNEIGDDDFLGLLSNDSSEVTKLIMWCFERRQLYKSIYTITHDDMLLKGRKDNLIARFHETPIHRFQLEREIETNLGLPCGTVILYCPGGDMNLKEAKTHVLWKESPSMPLNIAEERNDNRITQGELGTLELKYKNLWRMYLLIHPALKEKYQDDVVKYFKNEIELFNGGKILSEDEIKKKKTMGRCNLALDIYLKNHPDYTVRQAKSFKESLVQEVRTRVQDKKEMPKVIDLIARLDIIAKS